MSRESALERIEEVLRTVTIADNPERRFHEVIRGKSLGVPPADRIVRFWYMGEGEKADTFGNVMPFEKFMIQMLWSVRLMSADLAALELEIWDATRNVQAAFRADSRLTGADGLTNCEKVDFGLADANQLRSFTEGGDYRGCEIEMELWNLEGEAIAI